MRITVISPGKVRESWLQRGIEEYIRRLRRYSQVKIVEVTDFPDSWPKAKILAAEAEKIFAKIAPADHVVALDLAGKRYDSIAFSQQLMRWMEVGGSHVVFVIGGSHGLSPAVTQRAQASLCLSELTFTHLMSRLLLLEQCYRSMRIINHEPYHK